MKKIFDVILAIYFVIVIYIFSFLMHVFTAYCVYDSYGAFLGLIAFFSPVISTIIMFLLYTIFYGLFNGFNIILVIYLLSYIPLALLYWIVAKLEEKEKNKETKKQQQIIENVEYEKEFFEELKKSNNEYDKEKLNNVQPLYCSQCGTKLEENSSFCHNCGNKVKE